MSKRTAPEVNAGSMADIAFLLLIFFLVTTTIEKDHGLARQLSPEKEIIVTLHERNVLEIKIGQEGDLLVENDLLQLSDLSEVTIAFLDNGGAIQTDELFCAYCKGERNPLSSDSPQEAVISISSHREAPYETYISVQNELSAAYAYLRNRESKRRYNYEYSGVKRALDNGTLQTDVFKTKQELKEIRDLYPMLISEAEIKAVHN